MIKVKAINVITDKKEKRRRKKGDIFTVTKERLAEINGTHHGKLVEVIKEEKEHVESNRHNIETDKRSSKIKDNK